LEKFLKIYPPSLNQRVLGSNPSGETEKEKVLALRAWTFLVLEGELAHKFGNKKRTMMSEANWAFLLPHEPTRINEVNPNCYQTCSQILKCDKDKSEGSEQGLSLIATSQIGSVRLILHILDVLFA